MICNCSRSPARELALWSLQDPWLWRRLARRALVLRGSGVYVENRIDMDALATINGDGATGISAASISVLASDVSLISAFAGAVAISAGLGGTAGVSLSVGAAIARNDIGNSSKR